MSIADYLEWYVLYIPHEVYWWGGGVFLMLLLVLSAWKGWRGARWALALLLIEYVALLMYFTVFFRRATGVHEWKLMPLWSYKAIGQGVNVLMEEVAMNVAVFVPIGFLLGVIYKGCPWWKLLISGICVSIVIELLQLVLMRGVCETDDVLHNSLGCLMGVWIAKAVAFAAQKLKCSGIGIMGNVQVIRDIKDINSAQAYVEA